MLFFVAGWRREIFRFKSIIRRWLKPRPRQTDGFLQRHKIIITVFGRKMVRTKARSALNETIEKYA
jgi:hypothetical protein